MGELSSDLHEREACQGITGRGTQRWSGRGMQAAEMYAPGEAKPGMTGAAEGGLEGEYRQRKGRERGENHMQR